MERIDDRTEWDLIQTIEDAIGGIWESPETKWDGRRDAVLDLVGRAMPGSFRPALQIDPGAKLLIEALSGRWGYENDRREKRTVWFYVANAFSLLISTITPTPSHEEIKVISNFPE